nr:hypothetical protein [Tanacetum cinerariifolium]
MLVEKDYPLRKGLALMMINYKLQVENYSQMANDLILKIYKIANPLRQQEQLPTASEERCHCQKKSEATARKIALLSKVKKKLMNDLLDDNNFFIFDDVNVRISPVCKMPSRKKPSDSMHVRSKSNSNKSLPRTVHKWLPKLQPLAEPVAKWFPRVMRQIDKISKTPNSPRPIYKWVPRVC